MRHKNTELMIRIKDFIESCFEENHRMPTVREIAAEMKVAPSCVHRYLVEMDERDMISYSNGRMSTEKIDKISMLLNEIDKNVNEVRNKKKMEIKQANLHNDKVKENNKWIVIYSIIEICTMIMIFLFQSCYINSLVNKV